MVVRKGYKQTEIGEIPENWEFRSLSDITKKIADRDHFTPTYTEKGIPIISPKDIDDDMHLRLDNVKYITQEAHEKNYKKTDIKPLDIIFSRIGAGLGKSILVDENFYHFSILHSLCQIRTNQSVIPQYLLYFLRSNLIQKRIWVTVQSIGVPDLGLKEIGNLPIFVPPLGEQQKIATLLSDIDLKIQKQQEYKSKLETLKKGLMQELLTGKRRLEGFSEDWENTELGELGYFSKGKGIKKDEISDSGFSCIRYGEIYTKYDTYVTQPISHISKNIVKSSYKIKTGDILFAGSGEDEFDIGKCIVYLGNDECYAGGDIIVFTPFNDNPLFLSYLLNSKNIKKQMTSMAQGDMVVHIYSSHLKSIFLQIPSSNEEQSEIAKILSDMDCEIEALEKQRDKYINLKQGMMQKLLTGEIRLV